MATDTTAPTETEELLTVREVAKILKVHVNTIRKWDKEDGTGVLKAIRVGPGKQRRFRKSDVLALLQNNR
jgi:excisionase family DNA binding protein